MGLGDGSLTTDLYTKPTDSHNYLLYDSSHPLHCKNSMPYSQFLRIRRICSNLALFDKNANLLKGHFLRRGYPEDLIDKAKEKARAQDRQALIIGTGQKQRDKTDSDKLFAIDTFQPNFSGLKGIIKKHWHQLLRSNDTKYLFDTKIVFGHRRNKNLRDLLVRAKVSYPPKARKQQTGPVAHNSPCATKNCRYCPKLNTTGRIMCSVTHREYSSKIRVDCKSSNLIYCITCNH